VSAAGRSGMRVFRVRYTYRPLEAEAELSRCSAVVTTRAATNSAKCHADALDLVWRHIERDGGRREHVAIEAIEEVLPRQVLLFPEERF